MLRLRPYKKCDAEAIVSWIGDERSFRQWCSDRFPAYPITARDLNDYYDARAMLDNHYEMTAFDESGVAGHLILRFTDEEKKILRFGFVIVDSRRRGAGLGKEMLGLAIRYGFEILKAETITLGVFENNASAYRCYRSVGFRETGKTVPHRFFGEDWNVIELELPRPEQ